MQQLNKKSNVLDASAFVGASFCRYPVGVLQGGSRFLVPDLHLHYGGRLWRAREAEQRQGELLVQPAE